MQCRAAGLREAWATAHGEKLVDQHYLATLDGELAREKARLIQEYNDKVAALKAEAASKQVAFAEKKAINERERTLLKHGDVSEGMLKPVTQQMQAAASVHESAAAKLAALTAQLTAIHNNVFVGDDLMASRRWPRNAVTWLLMRHEKPLMRHKRRRRSRKHRGSSIRRQRG